MTAFWLTYKPLSPSSPRGWPAEDLSNLVERFEKEPSSATVLWRFASYQSASIGDRVYLFKQGSNPRGLFGFGEIIDLPRLQIDPTDIDSKPRFRAKIKFEKLVDPRKEFLIEFDGLRDFVPETIITTQASGIGVPDDVAIEIEKRLAPLLAKMLPISSEEADDLSFDPDSATDERERAIRSIRLRRGQPAFRASLLEAYGRRCAITGCAIEDVLEAAHITPYGGKLTNHVSNGLLLRTDLHTLFDCGLLSIEPHTRTVIVAKPLKSSSYEKLAGRKIRPPIKVAFSPSTRNLEKRYNLYKAIHSSSD